MWLFLLLSEIQKNVSDKNCMILRDIIVMIYRDDIIIENFRIIFCLNKGDPHKWFKNFLLDQVQNYRE